MNLFRSVVAAPVVGLLAATAAAQDSIPAVIVTVENAQPGRGVFLTPPWIAFHDGTFDTYDGGSPASVPLGGNEIEALAEDGNNAPLTATFAMQLPDAPQREGVPGPTGPLGPGDRASVAIRVNPMMDRYFSYASMVIPSNDAFIANGNPLAHQIFDDSGNFVAETFIVSGDETNDAGTEVNDEIASNVAFLAQGAPNTGDTENGLVVTPSPGFAAPGTLPYPDGVLNYPVFGNGDFNDADDRLFQVSFQEVDLGARIRFEASLSPEEEVQPDAVSSEGRGRVRAMAREGRVLRISARASNLSGPIVAAHLHLGASGTNGPVVVDMTSGIRATGNSVVFSANESTLTGPLAGTDFADFLGQVAAGNVYVNLHTAEYPDGEVRGNLGLAWSGEFPQ